MKFPFVVHSLVCSFLKMNESDNVVFKIEKSFRQQQKMQADRIFYDCRDKFIESIQQIERIESLTKDPTVFINQHFDLNKQHIQWRQRDLIADINKYSDQLIEENESNRSMCLQLSNETCQIQQMVDESRQKLEELKRQFRPVANKAVLSEANCERIRVGVSYLKESLCRTLKECQESLLLHKNWTFIYFDRPVENIVGKVVDKNQVKFKKVRKVGKLWKGIKGLSSKYEDSFHFLLRISIVLTFPTFSF